MTAIGISLSGYVPARGHRGEALYRRVSHVGDGGHNPRRRTPVCGVSWTTAFSPT